MKVWGKRQREEGDTEMIIADVHITLVRLVGTKLWTMEKERHVMLETAIGHDNVSVLVVSSVIAVCSCIIKNLISNCINLKVKSDLNYIHFH